MREWVLSVLLCLCLAGCLMGPNYQPRPPIVCDSWCGHTAETFCVASSEAPPTAWWKLFCDPLLDKYVEMAALNNRDILSAEAAICQAKAMRQVKAAPLYPRVNGDINAIRTYFSKNGPLFSAMPEGVPNSTTGAPFNLDNSLTIYNTILDAYWEIDLFGKTRRAIEAANANIGSAIEHRNDVLICTLAEVALNYIQLRSNQRYGQLIEENIALLERDAALVEKQYHAGYRNLLDVQHVKAQLAQAVAQLPDVLAHIYQNIYALSVLTGNLPETLACELLPIQPLPIPPEKIAVGLRSDLLRRRPDVRQAERQLAAAVANIGVAAASFFPSFFLLGDVGLQSLSLSNLLQARSLTWLLFGDLHIPLFEGGKLVGNLRANKAQASEAAYHYQQVILTAVEEAEASLIAYTQQFKTTEDLREATFRYEKLVQLTQARFSAGLVSVIDLLNIESQWNSVEQNLLSSATETLLNLVKLYKALGGGWQPDCR